mmetsp:Transcript_101419/g.194553  ORF Transcript_101419/g.194553 Transcript_101419/m.194553 type:complete len:113 (+) Transcript_101419:398-736(+)
MLQQLASRQAFTTACNDPSRHEADTVQWANTARTLTAISHITKAGIVRKAGRAQMQVASSCIHGHLSQAMPKFMQLRRQRRSGRPDRPGKLDRSRQDKEVEAGRLRHTHLRQ